jgi:hypothetical protein
LNASTVAMGVLSVNMFLFHLWRGEDANDQCFEDSSTSNFCYIYIMKKMIVPRLLLQGSD